MYKMHICLYRCCNACVPRDLYAVDKRNLEASVLYCKIARVRGAVTLSAFLQQVSSTATPRSLYSSATERHQVNLSSNLSLPASYLVVTFTQQQNTDQKCFACFWGRRTVSDRFYSSGTVLNGVLTGRGICWECFRRYIDSASRITFTRTISLIFHRGQHNGPPPHCPPALLIY